MRKLKALLITLFLTVSLASCDINLREVLNSHTSDKVTEAPVNTENTAVTTEPATPSPDVSEPGINATRPSATEAPSVSTAPSVTVAALETVADGIEPTYAVMSPPPFEYYLSDKAKVKEVNPLKLKHKSDKPNEIIDEDVWFQENGLTLTDFLEPGQQPIDLIKYLPEQVDAYCGDLFIVKAFYDNAYIYCVYGPNFAEGYLLNIYDAKSYQLLYSLDFYAYLYSPDYIEDYYDYIPQGIQWATTKDGILYISHSHNTYAKYSNHMNAYITAIDLSDTSIVWRSEALKCNSDNFILLDDVIISGYGFTAEPDYLYQINRYTGEVIDQISIKSSPYYIIQKNNILYVRTYNTDYEFEITN